MANQQLLERVLVSLCQVLFHLQLRQPPVLPPLHELFGDSAEAVSTRPLHFGGEIQHGVLEVSLCALPFRCSGKHWEDLSVL